MGEVFSPYISDSGITVVSEKLAAELGLSFDDKILTPDQFSELCANNLKQNGASMCELPSTIREIIRKSNLDTLGHLVDRALRTRRGKNWVSLLEYLDTAPLDGVCSYLLERLEPEKEKLATRDALYCLNLFISLQEFNGLPDELYARVLSFASFFLGQSKACDSAIDAIKRGDEYASEVDE